MGGAGCDETGTACHEDETKGREAKITIDFRYASLLRSCRCLVLSFSWSLPATNISAKWCATTSLNIPDAKIVAEYQEVAPNLYIRVLQDLERNPHAGLIVDLSGDPEGAIKALEKVKQAAPDLFVIASQLSRRRRDGDRLHARRRQRIPAAAAQAHRVPRRHGALERAPRTAPPRREQAGQGLHVPRHQGRSRHHDPGGELRLRAGAAQADYRR